MPAKKQITPEQILSAALSLLRRGGAAAVNVKALAAELGCSTQPIYQSFGSMDSLRAALIPEAVACFMTAMERENGGAPATLYSMAYIRAADAEPQLFTFLFLRPNAFAETRQALAPILAHSIADLQARYRLDYNEAHHLHDQLWMHAHGIASMTATRFCTWDMNKVRRMLDECHALLARKYEA